MVAHRGRGVAKLVMLIRVGLLATNDLLNGMVVVFYLGTFYVSDLQALLRKIRLDYVQFCSGAKASMPECEQLRESMDQAEGHMDVYLHLPMSVYAQGFFCIVAGAVGLWAVSFRSTRAVKLYMLSWPAKFWLAVWSALDMRKLQMKYDVERGPTATIISLLNIISIIYFFKVSRSYYNKRVAREDQPMLVDNPGV